jgi:two-component system response regulator NreC
MITYQLSMALGTVPKGGYVPRMAFSEGWTGDRTMASRYRVALAEDHVVLRQGLRSLLEKDGEIEVVAEASDGMEAIHCVQQAMPDVLIIDLTMPRLMGMDAIREIRKIHPDVKIIVLTVHTAEEYVYESLKAGANGYVLKAADFDELITAIRCVLKGKAYISPDISDTVVMGYLKSGSDVEPVGLKEGLTPREREVLKLVAEGYKNREIGGMLCVSIKTVEKHRENIKRKLDLHSTPAMIAYAMEHGLVRR